MDPDVLTADDSVSTSDFGSAGGMGSEKKMDSDRSTHTESGAIYMKTESDVSKGSYTTLKITVEAESRFRFRNEVACAISSGNHSEVAPRVYLYGYGIDGPLGAPWVLMDFFHGTTLESQLPGLSPAQQYATAEVLISLLQRSHRSRLLASGRIQAASHMKDEGAPVLWTRDQHHDVITIQPMCSDSDNLEHTSMTPTLADVSTPGAGRLPTLLQQLERKLDNLEIRATDDFLFAFKENCETIHTILDFEKEASLSEHIPMQSSFVIWYQDLAPRNILLDWSRWATDKVVHGTFIDWDEAISGPEDYTYTSPAQIMLECPRFRKTLSEESVRV